MFLLGIDPPSTYKLPGDLIFRLKSALIVLFAVADEALPEEDYSNRATIDLSNQLPGDLISHLESALNSQDDRVKKFKDKKLEPKVLSKVQVDNILESANIKTMDGCLKILAELHVSEALEDSE